MFATAMDVLDITGKSVSHAEIKRGQFVIESYVGATADDDIKERDAYWLKVALAYQVAYDEDNPSRPNQGLTSLSQGDLSMGFAQDVDVELAPRAHKALKRLSWAGNRSVRIGTLHPYVDEVWEEA